MARNFLSSTAEVLRLSRLDAVPPPFDQDEEHEIIFRRLLELVTEYCQAIDSLCDRGFFRPAHSVLRSVLENVATLIWIGLDPGRYIALFSANKQPNVRQVLERIGWTEEYEGAFKPLCSFVHADHSTSDSYKNYDYGYGEVSPELTPDSELYLLQAEDGLITMSVSQISPEEAEDLYHPFLAGKTFDLVLSGLERLFPGAPTRDWWPNTATLEEFELLCSSRSDLKPRLRKMSLWRDDEAW